MRAAAQQELPHELVSKNWVPAGRAGELVVFLSSGKADRLSGRIIHLLDDVADLVIRAHEIERDDLYVLGLRKYALLNLGWARLPICLLGSGFYG
jgi:hypothetical protein